jgi:N-acetylneuraminate synthase
LKIASFDANDMELIQEVAKCQKPTYISTGMRSERDIISLRGKIRSCITNFDPYFMYCISSYPAPIDQMNLHLLRQHWFYGLSDHSRHLLTGAVAVGCGARVIETHVRLNNTPKHNADYDVSFTPEEFKTYVNNIRDAEAMYGNLLQAREVQLCEHVMKKYVIK